MYFHDVASRPALHQSAWFERGGIRKGLQLFLSDSLGGPGVLGLGMLLLLGYCLFPLWRHPERLRKLKELGTIASVVTVLVLAFTWGPSNLFGIPTVHASSGTRPNVLIIAADSLRPDRIDERRAPNLTEFAKHATRFERTLTPLARTFPAWVSILTGQYPHHHGIRHMFPRWETRERPFETLATRFGREGYRTVVVGDFAADIFRRVDLGFQTVNTPTFTLRELVREHLFKKDPWLLAWMRGKFARKWVPSIVEIHDATCPWSVTEDAITELDGLSGRPFFLTVFYSTTHFPYAAPSPYHQEFRAASYDGRFRYAKADDLSLDEIRDPADITQIRALYDGAVRATDDAIGELLRGIKKRGLLENTVVVVTADHGEQLYEYGRSQGHGDHLEGDEALRIPFLVRDPRIARAHEERQSVSLVDLAPTVLDLAGLEPLSAADGRSLAAAVRGQPIAPKYVYGETGLWFTELIAEVPLSRRLPYPDLTRISEVDRIHGDQIVLRKSIETFAVAAKHRMLESNDYRLLYLPTREGPKFELYDRATDPGFTRDVAEQHPDVLAKLKPALFAWFDEDPMVARQGDTLWPQ
jgi:arylsulfatase A-like enzyme